MAEFSIRFDYSRACRDSNIIAQLVFKTMAECIRERR